MGKSKKPNAGEEERSDGGLLDGASMTVAELNNLIVTMRKPIRQARVRIFHDLSRKIKRLATPQPSADLPPPANPDSLDRKQIAAAKKLQKADRLRAEFAVLKRFQLDQVAKFALFNTRTFDDALKTGDEMESRALLRLVCSEPASAAVERFRREHGDWQRLAQFLLYKNTGRRFKRTDAKKQRADKKLHHQLVDLDLSAIWRQQNAAAPAPATVTAAARAPALASKPAALVVTAHRPAPDDSLRRKQLAMLTGRFDDSSPSPPPLTHSSPSDSPSPQPPEPPPLSSSRPPRSPRSVAPQPIPIARSRASPVRPSREGVVVRLDLNASQSADLDLPSITTADRSPSALAGANPVKRSKDDFFMNSDADEAVAEREQTEATKKTNKKRARQEMAFESSFMSSLKESEPASEVVLEKRRGGAKREKERKREVSGGGEAKERRKTWKAGGGSEAARGWAPGGGAQQQLHPSWQAKLLQRQKQLAVPGGKSKQIIFADD